MKILYIGHSNKSSTSFHRAKALERIGHIVEIQDPYKILENSNKLFSKVHYRTGYKFLQKKVKRWINLIASKEKYDLIWVNSGELFGADNIAYLKSRFETFIILYNNDDPTGGRDGRRFDMLLKAIPEYDMCVVMRDVNISEYYKLGAKKVIRVFMSYDEVEHAPLNLKEIPEEFKSQVSFIGTNIPKDNRDKFIYDLINRGVPISIWGGRWERSPYWKELKPHFRGQTLKGKDYIAAIQGSRICLGLLSKGNRDLHTTRTFEIPYMGSLLCAERTEEHMALFQEDIEAIFWKDLDECVEKCLKLLSNDVLIDEIKEKGRERLLKDQRGNENVVKYILDQVV